MSSRTSLIIKYGVTSRRRRFWKISLIVLFIAAAIWSALVVRPIVMRELKERRLQEEYKKRLHTRVMLRTIEIRIEEYYASAGQFPSGRNAELRKQLLELLGRTRIRTDAQGCMLDAWGRPFIVIPGTDTETPRVYSVGADGIDDGGKDGPDIVVGG